MTRDMLHVTHHNHTTRDKYLGDEAVRGHDAGLLVAQYQGPGPARGGAAASLHLDTWHKSSEKRSLKGYL